MYPNTTAVFGSQGLARLCQPKVFCPTRHGFVFWGPPSAGPLVSFRPAAAEEKGRVTSVVFPCVS